jgi:hypothetical protein
MAFGQFGAKEGDIATIESAKFTKNLMQCMHFVFSFNVRTTVTTASDLIFQLNYIFIYPSLKMESKQSKYPCSKKEKLKVLTSGSWNPTTLMHGSLEKFC